MYREYPALLVTPAVSLVGALVLGASTHLCFVVLHHACLDKTVVRMFPEYHSENAGARIHTDTRRRI